MSRTGRPPSALSLACRSSLNPCLSVKWIFHVGFWLSLIHAYRQSAYQQFIFYFWPHRKMYFDALIPNMALLFWGDAPIMSYSSIWTIKLSIFSFFWYFLTLFFQSRVIGLFLILMRSCSQIFIKFGWGLTTWILKLGHFFICFALFSLFLSLLALIFDISLGHVLKFCFPIMILFF